MRFRCAIYTRKSSDEGLEQEFNSLHAQREAARPSSTASGMKAGMMARETLLSEDHLGAPMHTFEDIKAGARLRGLDPAGIAEGRSIVPPENPPSS
jgi:hypothetical protein